MLIDSHAHLFFENYKLTLDPTDPRSKNFQNDLDQVIERAKQTGVEAIINVGVDLERSEAAVKQAETITDIPMYATIGIHPHDVEQYISNPEQLSNDISKLEALYHDHTTKIKAVGECGLDFYFHGNPDFVDNTTSQEALKQAQRTVLTAQIDLAKKLNLPVTIHCREAWDEILDYIHGVDGVFHCYSGDIETTKKVLETNFYISFAGNLTYPKAQTLHESAKLIPLNRLLVETDCPFLAPQTVRGQRNEPANVRETAQYLAQLKSVSYEDLAEQTTQNAKRLFGIAN